MLSLLLVRKQRRSPRQQFYDRGDTETAGAQPRWSRQDMVKKSQGQGKAELTKRQGNSPISIVSKQEVTLFYWFCHRNAQHAEMLNLRHAKCTQRNHIYCSCSTFVTFRQHQLAKHLVRTQLSLNLQSKQKGFETETTGKAEDASRRVNSSRTAPLA